MTAWFAIVLPLCLIVKSSVDFIVLEYGDKFRFISDDNLHLFFAIVLIYAVVVDIANFGRRKCCGHC